MGASVASEIGEIEDSMASIAQVVLGDCAILVPVLYPYIIHLSIFKNMFRGCPNKLAAATCLLGQPRFFQKLLVFTLKFNYTKTNAIS